MREQQEPLLPAERHRRIQQLLDERNVMRVSAMSELLGVSEVTIRRDLEELERRGVLERIHGGAISSRRLRSEPRYLEAMTSHAEEKRDIGRAAAALVEPGDTLFFNGGTTTLEVFRHLDGPNLRVVTNHVGVPLEVGDRELDLIVVGGQYRAPSNSLVGPFAVDALRRMHATKAFIGVEGISLRSGATTPSASEAEIARLMIERTRGDVILVADSSKIGAVADFVVTGLDEVTALVTDRGIDREFADGLAEAGVRVVVAEPAVAERRSGRSG
ncbi:MAG: DeoR/GlpR family DNA-binding transcription regulator [Actinomycetota bacterium]|nr:DeoR/GlpR family DNA-binding transcription regulator [Actinomycetota bacterium]